MSAHTPGPSLTSKCPDCGHVYLSHFAVNHKCPLHDAARELLEALEGAAKRLSIAGEEMVAKGHGIEAAIFAEWADDARAAIAKAKGGNNAS